ncbi:MAG TPA: peptide ABC transporter substrate-binding protein [Candidatus Acidoferrales bacterium]|nr:peptide ABC transporter substrate-binding protein [Candidatus Acidoferrales bacterium]
MSDLYDFSHLYISSLLEVDNRGRLIPEIAAVVPTTANGGISRDGLTITYHLRPGIKWQDGAALTSRDVAFTYRAMMNPKNNVPSRTGYDHIVSVKTPDALTVIVHLARSFSPILAYFETAQGITGILPAHVLERYTDINRVPFNVKPIGSGPYRVVQWQHGDHITLEANPLYWRGKPRINRIVYKIVPDHNTQVQQLRTREVDAYFNVDPQLLTEVRTIPGLTLTLTPIPDFHYLHFNLRDPVVGDARVRRAIALAVDRSKLIMAGTHGAGIAVDGDQSQLSWAYDGTLPHLRYDPEAARRLLTDAGWKSAANGPRAKLGVPLTVQLSISPTLVGGSRLVAVVVQEDLRAVGVDVRIKEYPASLLWAAAQSGGPLMSGHYQMAYNAWWVLGPDPDDSWNLACDQIPPVGQNMYFWCNPRANFAMHDALATFDIERRKHDYSVVQHEMLRELPLLPLWQVRRPDAYTPRLKGVSPSPAGSTFWNAWSWTLN